MRATEFEFRHQTLLSQLLIGAAVATYAFDGQDIVWRFIKGYANWRVLEHSLFLAATILIGAGAWLCTEARVRWGGSDDSLTTPSHRFGELIYAVGLGTLLPLAGFILLVAGQAIRLMRLAGRCDDARERERSTWANAFRHEAAKWGLLLTMIVFTITLVDRQADYLAGASYLVWVVLNIASRSPR